MPRADRVRSRRVDAGEAILAAGVLADPTYIDAFAIDSAQPGDSAEQWARATFEDAPAPLRWFLRAGWRWVLRLRLGPSSSPDLVLGWKIAAARPDLIVLAAESSVLGPARLAFHLTDSRLTAATLIHFQTRLGRALWCFLGPVHRQVMPRLLTRAAVGSADGF